MRNARNEGTPAPQPARLLDRAGLDHLISLLAGDGRAVIGPVRDGPVVDLGPLASTADLPVGVRDHQEPGRYLLVDHTDGADGDGSGDALFATAAPSRPWKRYLHPERVLLIRSSRGDDGDLVIEPAATDAPPPLAFVGIRACDLAALGRLGVALDGDPDHAARRADVVTVAVACTRSADTCFCASTGTGPQPGPGADLVLTEVGPDLLAEARTGTGAELLDRCGAAPAPAELVARAGELVEACRVGQTRALDPAAVAAAAAAPDDASWDEVATRCLTCGNCTMVCPTCFCTSVEDSTSLVDHSATRTRVWASCFSPAFTEMHGGPVRLSAMSRYRHWYLHKLVTWHDQFGSSGCVGCGRCITWCPTGIDLTGTVIR